MASDDHVHVLIASLDVHSPCVFLPAAQSEQAGDGSGSELHSEQLILPGSPGEMAEFERHSSSRAQCSVRCCLPLVCVHLPSNEFLSTLYNRY